MRVPRQSISAPPKTLAGGIDTTFLTGICKLQDKLIMLLDIDKVIVEEEELEKILQAKDAL
jgi:purine-binding chemotaxis protein CheW